VRIEDNVLVIAQGQGETASRAPAARTQRHTCALPPRTALHTRGYVAAGRDQQAFACRLNVGHVGGAIVGTWYASCRPLGCMRLLHASGLTKHPCHWFTVARALPPPSLALRCAALQAPST
jgi:hypothetical protein